LTKQFFGNKILPSLNLILNYKKKNDSDKNKPDKNNQDKNKKIKHIEEKKIELILKPDKDELVKSNNNKKKTENKELNSILQVTEKSKEHKESEEHEEFKLKID